MLKPLSVQLPDVAATHALAERIARQLQPGDLVILTGDLGAGKTTFTQGLGAALGVRGRVSSPTFIIAREHPGAVRADGGLGLALIHVDAYRLGNLDELDALDLDSSMEDSVTVVEWGKGIVEGLSDSYLEIELTRERGPVDEALETTEPDTDEPRRAFIRAVGPRWANVQI